jgi:hypothetical protein
MTPIHPANSPTNEPETIARTTAASEPRGQSGSGNFFAAMFASLKRAGLGRFFGVAPPPSRSHSKNDNQPEQASEAENAETRQAKDIYQAMLDISGH